jgi:hypothetical protein
MTINVHWSSCKVTVGLFVFKGNFNSLDRFSKNTQITNFTKICPMEVDLFHAGGRTDRHNAANSHFSQFCERA